ncbi:MAG: ABC transporter substrate-binding protein, partial [Candidatus Lokiarchaeota archaeon]|nr:ABC transporter substrate-binding protein [Candidatus Lokiarchaeota archaeon]
PNLALSGTWNPDATEFTVILRQGVKFHDGAPFNADAVIFTWDRMAWALNATGTNTDGVTQVAELYEFPNRTPIVKEVIKNGDYSVTFGLNGAYVPFEALLCFSASYILSPLSTPANAYIDTATGDIVGTGPFVYDNYEVDFNVTFHAFDDYWKGRAQIDKLIFSIITDANARNAALYYGEIDFLSDPMDYNLDVFNTTEGIAIEEGPHSTVTQYLGMNNQQINVTIREAISYAFDYDYIIDVLKEGYVVRMESPVPKGIRYANCTFDVSILNLSRARTAMQSMGFGVGWDVTPDGPDELLWEEATFMTLNYTYNIGSSFRDDLLVLLQDNLGKIGIVVEDAGMTWGEFIYRLYEIGNLHRNMLQLYWIGWGPDYNDPSNYINPVFTNRSDAFNGAQYNGYTAAIEAGRDPLALWDNVQLLMEAGLTELDPVAREAIYDRIQELLIEHDRPWAFGYVSKKYVAMVSNLHGYQQNPMGKEYFYPCYFT